ncbi:MAG: citrate synthase [Planctomycetes bacterium]|nr:citrate synthase [Planctomycetota bacterium]
MGDTAKLIWNGQTLDLPVLRGSEGENAVQIGELRQKTSLVTMDPAYMNTGSCTSQITFLDGEKGILRYRGYPIEELAEKSTFPETSYLLIHGELPNREQLAKFRHDLTYHSMLHEDFKRFFESFPKGAHPMPILSSGVCALSTYYQAGSIPDDPAAIELAIHRLLAKLPTIAAFSYKKSIGHPLMYPRNDLEYCANFLQMMFSVPAEAYRVDPVAAKALDLVFILHADHEQNCCNSTVRLVGSARVNLYACISAGICALWGPLHGGANQAVIEMLERLRNDKWDLEKFVGLAKKKGSNFRLMGFGHRVYKNFDPRAKILKRTCDDLLAKMKRTDPLLDIAKQLEEVALRDEYFIERKLYPNVDFYSGIIYRALGFPVQMFTVLFALGRLPGWIAQWREMVESPDTKIGRPRQVYTGAPRRPYVPIEQRG